MTKQPLTITEQGITVETLYQDLLSQKQSFILDVRNESDFARWRIEGHASLQVVNIPYFNFIEDESEAMKDLPTDTNILVVCAKEGSSEFVTEILQSHGYKATYLIGGIMSWGNYYNVHEIVTESFGRILQIARPARGDLSFMVISDGQAAIIDPLRHIEVYTNTVAETNTNLTHIFDTHAHADHISGGPALAQTTEANYYLHPYDGIHPLDMLPARISYQALSDEQSFQIGQFAVKTIWFPGHTLGQVNFLFTAPTGSSYLFTGDGIFLRSFGRPDLGGRGEAWTPILYHSLFEKLPKYINNDTVILPAHFSTLAEGDSEGRFMAPYGLVCEQNESLTPHSLAEFSDYVLGNLPTFPPEYVEIKRVNAGLVIPSEETASELELGKNICALAD